MAKNKKNIADFRASDGLEPIVMQKLNTNFWNLMEMFDDPEIVAVSSVSEPTPHTDEMLWYKTDTGTLYIWSQIEPGVWGWKDATDVVIESEEARRLITEIAMEAGGDKNYVHVQSVPSSTWVIDHNLDKMPSVRVEDSSGNDVVGDYRYDSNNRMTLTFAGSFAGTAYLN
jgi:hypothetical protein